MTRRAAGLALVVTAAVAIVVWQLRPDDGGDAPRPDLSSAELRAVEVAWASVAYDWKMGDKWRVQVKRDGDVFILTWPNPPGTSLLQGDFLARVKVDAKTYEVITISIGS